MCIDIADRSPGSLVKETHLSINAEVVDALEDNAIALCDIQNACADLPKRISWTVCRAHLADDLCLTVDDLRRAVLLDFRRLVVARVDGWNEIGRAQVIDGADAHLRKEVFA